MHGGSCSVRLAGHGPQALRPKSAPRHWETLFLWHSSWCKIEKPKVGRGGRGIKHFNSSFQYIIHSRDMSLNKLREIVKDREAWRGAVHGVAKSRAQLSDWTTTFQWICRKPRPPAPPPPDHPPSEEPWTSALVLGLFLIHFFKNFWNLLAQC